MKLKPCPFCGQAPRFEGDASVWRDDNRYVELSLTRVGPSNGLDDDNLAGALKGVRDEIAEWLGVNDRDRKTVRYEYEQRRGKEWAVEIAIRPMLSVDDALRVVGAV